MRCPKCGFISFDHLDTCLKCNKDIKRVSDNLPGSVYNVAAPAFLKFNTEPDSTEVDVVDAFLDEDDAFDDEPIRDPDLDILMDEDSEDGDEIEMHLDGSDDDDVDIAISDDSEADSGLTFNLDEFDDDADISDESAESIVAEKSVDLNLPEELSDMSDLEPPSESQEVAGEAGDEDFTFDLNLDLDDELETVVDETQEKTTDLADLSLGDLDFDEEPMAAAPEKKAASRSMALDDDLDFELDLGDLRLDEDDEL